MLPTKPDNSEHNGRKDDVQAEISRESTHDFTNITVSCKLRLSREKGFYGPGAHQLLQLTQACGSLSQACQQMGMSYSKGRKIIATLEEQLGVPILETRQGGKSGGSSHLTDAARELIGQYGAFQAEADAALQEIFLKYFPKEEA